MKFIPIIFIAVIPTFVWADDFITNNIVNGCGDAYYYGAEFEPISYNCASGQFLPAGAVSCAVCPQTHTCSGGTFAFNANQTQGLSDGDILVTDAIGSCSVQFNQSFSAVFEPITYTCSVGYYLPAGEDWINDYEGCRKCPLNHYCIGGTYTYNETTTQGITECPSALPFAPTGSYVCYPHILHVGDDVVYLRSTKQTTPSLNIQLGNEIFYANMTTTPTHMSAASEHYLKIEHNNQIYYVCDDTVYSD